MTWKPVGAIGDALAEHVLQGRTFSSEDAGVEVEGQMPNNGSQVITPDTSNQTISEGYHDGGGYVEGDNNLQSSNIRSGVTIFGVTGNVEEDEQIAYNQSRTWTPDGNDADKYDRLMLLPGNSDIPFKVDYSIDQGREDHDIELRCDGNTVKSGTSSGTHYAVYNKVVIYYNSNGWGLDDFSYDVTISEQ